MFEITNLNFWCFKAGMI